MINLSLRSEIKRKSYLKIYSLFEYLLFDHFATMGAERRWGALPPATRSGRPQWMPTHARAVIMVSSFRFQAGGDDCVPGQRSRTATRITILVSNFSAGGGRLRTRTAQPGCDVAENLQIVTLKFGHVRKKM